MFLIKKLNRNNKGGAMVEYALLIAGVALIGSAALAIFGHKTNDMIATTAAILPGAHPDDNNPIVSGKIIETAANADGNLALDVAGIAGNPDSFRLGDNLLGAGNGAIIESLVVEP